MPLFTNKKMDTKTKVIALIAIVVTSGLPMWLSTYSQYLNHLWISGLSVLLATICAGSIAIKTNYPKRNVIFSVIGLHMVALLVKMVIDCIPDKSNHNLAPFEFIMLFVVDLVFIGVAVIVFRPAKRKIPAAGPAVFDVGQTQ